MRDSFDPEPFADRDSSQRRQTFLPAKVVACDGVCLVDCLVRNISEGGAGIEFAADQIVPNQLFLIDMGSGTAYRAEVRWHKPKSAGLRLLQKISLDGSVSEEFLHLKRVWETDRAPPTPVPVNATPDMATTGVAAHAAGNLYRVPALEGEHDDMARGVTPATMVAAPPS